MPVIDLGDPPSVMGAFGYGYAVQRGEYLHTVHRGWTDLSILHATNMD